MDFPPFALVYHKRTKSPIHAGPKQSLGPSGLRARKSRHSKTSDSGGFSYPVPSRFFVAQPIKTLRENTQIQKQTMLFLTKLKP
jgi:hypothetical protein